MLGRQDRALVGARREQRHRGAVGRIGQRRGAAHEGDLGFRLDDPQRRHEGGGVGGADEAVERRGEPEPVGVGQAVGAELHAEAAAAEPEVAEHGREVAGRLGRGAGAPFSTTTSPWRKRTAPSVCQICCARRLTASRVRP